MTSFGQGKLLSVNLYNATFHTSLWPRQNVLLLWALWIFFHLMLPWVCPFEFSCILHALYRDKQTIKRSLLKETNSRGQCFSLLLLLPKAKGKKKKHKKKITLISCKLLGTAFKKDIVPCSLNLLQHFCPGDNGAWKVVTTTLYNLCWTCELSLVA